MRVQVFPERVELLAGTPIEAVVTVTNTADIIGGYHLRVLGADPSWVTLGAENLSLFPDTTESVPVRITVPEGVPAGDRRIAVQVRELTAPQAISVTEIELVVPAQEALRVELTPTTVIAGGAGRFGITAENTGNTTVTTRLVGTDPEAVLHFSCSPAVLQLAPGEHAIADLRVRGPRRWLGAPVVRAFGVTAVPLAADGAPVGPDPAVLGAADGARPAAPDPEPLAQGTLLQKPRIGRGALSLLSLLVAVTVFATVITVALSRLANVSAADRDLALQVAAAAGNTGEATGSSALGGTVTLRTGSPAKGVTVEVFTPDQLTTPVSSTATADDGTFSLAALTAGSYKLRFRGAGLAEIWYPAALTGADAEAITLATGQQRTDLAVTLGGLPATVTGQIAGDDVAGAVLTVAVPADRLAGAGAGAGTAPTVKPTLVTGSAAPSAAPGAAGGEPAAVLRTVPISSDGRFSLSGLPSPAVYELSISKPGYATDTQRIDLTGGEARGGVQLRLRTGDGLVTGSVLGPQGPLGEAVVTATSGGTTVKTVTLTQGAVGTFTLRGLVTPGTYTVTVTADGFSTQTSTVSLAAGQKLTGLRFTLSRSSGSLAGTVTTVADGKPAPGVTVTVSSGELELSTVTQSSGTVGGWTVAGLPLPGVYTVTLSRPDLQSQTVSVTLDQAGNASTGSAGIAVAMRSAFATVTGTVTQRSPTGGAAPVGEASVVLASGADTYTVTSASYPAADVGRFVVTGVKPGTYTLSAGRRGTSPTTVTVTVVAGQDLRYDPVLIPGAGLTGRITDRQGGSTAGLTVELYESATYPAQVYRSTTVADDGTYTFTDVDAPQSYIVQVRSAVAGPLGSATLVLSASQSGRLDLTVSLASAGTAGTTGAVPPGTPPTGTGTGTGTDTGTGTTGTSTTPGVPATTEGATG